MILIITGTVCFSVLSIGFTIGVILIVQPATDLSPWLGRFTNLLSGLIGLLAGYLAGRTRSSSDQDHSG